MHTTAAPERTEAADYYFTYISQVPSGDVREILAAQLPETLAVLYGVTELQSIERYAPGKWSIRQVVAHLSDTERLFVFRALWFARGFDSPLPSFDQDVAIATCDAEHRSFRSLVAEFRTVREATVTFFQSLPEDAWMRHGIASGNPFSVRALAFISAGHLAHHLRILREKYL